MCADLLGITCLCVSILSVLQRCAGISTKWWIGLICEKLQHVSIINHHRSLRCLSNRSEMQEPHPVERPAGCVTTISHDALVGCDGDFFVVPLLLDHRFNFSVEPLRMDNSAHPPHVHPGQSQTSRGWKIRSDPQISAQLHYSKSPSGVVSHCPNVV